MSGKILRITDCDTGEAELEIYEVPEGVCIVHAARDGDDLAFRSVTVEPRKALKLAAWLAARFAGKVTIPEGEDL